jgi:hypothetical protein
MTTPTDPPVERLAGTGLLGAAFAIYGGGVLVAAAVVALDLVLPLWAAVLVALSLLAAVVGLVARVRS